MGESLHRIDTDCRASRERARARRAAAERTAPRARLTIADLLLGLGVAVLVVLAWAIVVFTGYMVGLAVGL